MFSQCKNSHEIGNETNWKRSLNFCSQYLKRILDFCTMSCKRKWNKDFADKIYNWGQKITLPSVRNLYFLVDAWFWHKKHHLYITVDIYNIICAGHSLCITIEKFQKSTFSVTNFHGPYPHHCRPRPKFKNCICGHQIIT